MKKQISILAGLSVLFFLNFKAYSQTGPAGVGSSANNVMWFKADALGLSDNDPVTTWTDESGNSNNATQGTASYKPTFKTSQVNGLPAILFDGTSDYLETGAIAALNDDNTITWFVVCSLSNTSTSYSIFRTNHVDNEQYWGTEYHQSSNTFRTRTRRADDVTVSLSTSAFNSEYRLLSTTWNGSTIRIYHNGTAGTNGANANGVPGNHNFTRIGTNTSTPPGLWMPGTIPEFIVYNSVLNTAERIIVGNYLASKYGLTHSSDRYAYDATYGFEVAGIGIESDGSNATAQGTGILEVSAASDMATNGEYLLFGHNNGSLIATATGIPAEYNAALGRVLPREWVFDETASQVGTVTLTFDLSGITCPTCQDNGYELLLDADGDFTAGATRRVTGVSYNNLTQVLTCTGVDPTGDLYFTVGNTGCNGTMTSIASTDWNTGTTWDCAVPNTNSDVVIDGETVTLTASSVADDVTISSGTLNGGSGDLTMTGSLSVTGTLTGSTSTITMSGSVSKTISGGGTMNFNNLTINKTGGTDVTVSNAMNIIGTLDIDAGTFNTGGLVTFISDASGTATVADLTGGGSVSGDVIIQRYINEQNPGWYMLCSPLTDADFEDWNQEFFMSGSGFVGSDWLSGQPTVVSWNEATETFNAPASTASTITNGADESGIFCYIGNDGIGTDMPKTLDITGTLRTGGFTISGLANTDGDASGLNQGGWHMLGNPFARPIVYDNLIANAGTSNINATGMRLLNTGSYGAIAAGGVIASGEAFWVYTPGSPDGSLEFQENDKSAVITDTYNEKMIENPLGFNIVLSVGNYSDAPAQVVLKNTHFNYSSSIGYDPLLDAAKKPNIYSRENLATVINGQNFLVNYIPDTISQLTIPIRVWEVTPSNINKTYTLSFNDIASFSENNKCLIFEDIVAGISFPLMNDTSYTVTMRDTTYEPRFFIHISSPVSVSVIENSCFGGNQGTIIAQGSGTVNYLWKNQAGDTLRNVTTSFADSITNLFGGIYYLTVSGVGTCGTVSSSFEIEEPEQFTTTETVADVSCFGGSDGKAIVQPDTTGIFTYVWTNASGDTVKVSNNVSGADTLSGAVVGQYFVSVTKNSGCISTVNENFTISSPSDVSVISTVSDLACYGMTDGGVQLYPTGGISPYSYLWSTGETTQEIYDLPDGNYSVTVTDANGCQKLQTITVSQPADITVTANVTDASCFSYSDGNISLSVNGGNFNFQYQWSNGSTDNPLANITAGTYSVTVSDDYGCTKTSSISVSQPADVVASFTMNADTIDIALGATANFTNSSSGASTYQWDFGDGNFSTQSQPSHTYSAVGTYIVSLIASEGNCSDTIQQTIVVINTLSVNENNSISEIAITRAGQNIIVLCNFTELTKTIVSLYNILGQEMISQKIYEMQSGKIEIQLPETRGVYFLKIDEQNKTFVYKLTK